MNTITILVMLTYSFAIFSLITLWVKNLKKITIVSLAISLILALSSGIINIVALAIILISFLAIYFVFKLENKRVLGVVIFFITSLLLFLNYNHLLPGFNRYVPK